ncbi:hypothetical protein Bca101_054796 [Brassica carinata]
MCPKFLSILSFGTPSATSIAKHLGSHYIPQAICICPHSTTPVATRFKSSLRNLRKISNPSFLEDGTPVVQAPASVLLKTAEIWKDHIVAHFHGTRPPPGKIFADLNPVWGKFGDITIRTVSETSCLIFVPNVQTREWVLQVGYWQVDHCAVSVFPWSSEGILEELELRFAPTWVILKNVPPQLYSLDGISVVASAIGEPLHTEKSRLDPYHFGDTKVKVEIDLSIDPPKIVEVRDSESNSVRINIEYPKLPPKCCNCGKFGHLMNRCPKPMMKRNFQARVKESEKSKIAVASSSMSLTKTEVSDIPPAPVVEVEKQVSGASPSTLRRARSRSRARERSGGGGQIATEVEVAEVIEKSEGLTRTFSAEGLETNSGKKDEHKSLSGEKSGCEDPVNDNKEVDHIWLIPKAVRRAQRQLARRNATGDNLMKSKTPSFPSRAGASGRKLNL